jgi:hypothetical protein
MDDGGIALMERPRQSPPSNMGWVPSGAFLMGSDKHYQKEGVVTIASALTISGSIARPLPASNSESYTQGGVAGLHTAETSGRSARLVAMVEIQIRRLEEDHSDIG